MIALQLFAALFTPQNPVPAEPRPETVYWDSIGALGQLEGGTLDLVVVDPGFIEGRIPAPVQTLTNTSSFLPGPAHAIDVVFVGDGYQAGQLGAYAAHVDNIMASFFTREPYREYESYFAVHRVDVVSVDSGVDNDPTQGIQRNTAMDMGFWCGGTERALCVDVGKAYMFANNAPAVDLVAAIANSSKYGGVGYPSSSLATGSGNNGSSVEIMMHEFGHALGLLADEYDYGSSNPTYTGGEPGQKNISKLTSAQMLAAGTKWAAWLGVNNGAFDGLISTFEGAGYHEFGLFRPTNNSLMRSLGRPFNLPGAERMILEFYSHVPPIDASSSTSTIYTGTETLFVTPMQPRTHSLSVQWFRDGAPIASATSTTLNLAALPFIGCGATISVRVRDDTPWVRDEAERAARMTQTLTFQVAPSATNIATFCVSAPNSTGLGAAIEGVGSTSIAANDMTLVTANCPPNGVGLYYVGNNAVQQPFGDGFRCVSGSVFRLATVNANLFGDAVLALDIAQLTGAGPLAPGDTRRFQFWYRNPAAGGAGFNLSNGLALTFCP